MPCENSRSLVTGLWISEKVETKVRHNARESVVYWYREKMQRGCSDPGRALSRLFPGRRPGHQGKDAPQGARDLWPAPPSSGAGLDFAREVVTMSNEANLIPMDQRSEDEVRELGRRGGIASGAVRRRKRSLREAADLYLSLPVTDRRRVNKLLRRAVNPEDIDNQMAMIAGLTDAATEGDARAATVLVKLLGEATPPAGDNDTALAQAARLLEDVESVIE